MKDASEILSCFHPLVAEWFTDKYGRPTDVQSRAWPVIASGDNVLVTAPTGSGKTLTAFLWAVNQLIKGEWSEGVCRVLYISPLKALNNDIRRNLLEPLGELRTLFEQNGLQFPGIKVMTRSGDTDPSERRKMLRHPPEILITTPESLNIMLSSTSGRFVFTGLKTVILDEIHSVYNVKRGTYLISAVDRLVGLSGEFQRIALSATIRPPGKVAEFVGGYELEGAPEDPRYLKRPVSIVGSSNTKKYNLQVFFPVEEEDEPSSESVWKPIVEELKKIIGRNRSTLIFVNSRRLCEKITYKINSGEEGPIAYSHHGSLSREIRSTVENGLKEGRLKAIVATNSLELGIDIGALDEVVMIQSPPSISSAVQRVGRSGHQVGAVSRGVIFPSHSHDILEAAVLSAEIAGKEIEPLNPVECPLDVLAQIIISMTGSEIWDIDRLYNQLKTSYPYRNLDRDRFDLVLNMLGGRYADSRIRELKARISIDRLDNTITAKKGALLTYYMSGGVIPDRGYYRLRHQESSALIGELDEEYVWEARIGDNFTLGAQNWKIQRITHNDVFVSQAKPNAMAAPFWKAEERNRDYHYSSKIGEFLETADQSIEEKDFKDVLQSDYFLDSNAAGQLINYLKRQKEETGIPLPHCRHVVVERISAGPGGAPGSQVVIHNFWGGRINRPLSLAIEAAWVKKFGAKPEVFAGNDSIALVMTNDLNAGEILSLVGSANVLDLLKERLESSGFFGARFRECAGRALLISKGKFNERMPLWITRLRSEKLLGSVKNYGDFPILLETWRTCLQDEFDLDNLHKVLAELETGIIEWSEARTAYPSPMAGNIAWRQINEYMYRTDDPKSNRASGLTDDLIREMVMTPDLRPTVSLDVIEAFESKRKRLSPGYSPSGARDLVDWVKERLLIPEKEWSNLVEAMKRDHGPEVEDQIREAEGKLVRIDPASGAGFVVTALENASRLTRALYDQNELKMDMAPGKNNRFDSGLEKDEEDFNGQDEIAASILTEWLQFHGPVDKDFIIRELGIKQERLERILEIPIASRDVIIGLLIKEDDREKICDSRNFESLLRLARAWSVPAFEPLEIKYLAPFLASHQGLLDRKSDIDSLFSRLEQLECLPVSADLWETEIFPARTGAYRTALLDEIFQDGEIRWIGSENKKAAFCHASDLDLLMSDPDGNESQANKKSAGRFSEEQADFIGRLFRDPAARYDFTGLSLSSGLTPKELSDKLWEAAWSGAVTTDTYATVRKAIENRFQFPGDFKPASSRMGGRRAARRPAFGKWKSSLPYAGAWFKLNPSDMEKDAIDIEEMKKDRVRLLLDRYGIIFKELLRKESPQFQWSALFRSLRLMELSGEISAGCFFRDIQGLQFISQRALRAASKIPNVKDVFWINSTDPASICGLGLKLSDDNLPHRQTGNHIVYHRSDVVMVSRRNGKDLFFYVPEDHPGIMEYLGPLHHLLNRNFMPLKKIKVETINNEPAGSSNYAEALRTAFESLVEHKTIILFRRLTG